MVPEILIVGDESRRAELGRRVEALGYGAALCSPDELGVRLDSGPAPAAIVVSVSGGEAPQVMAELRRSRRGAAVPVTLTGKLGGVVRDLADVLDLGADHFLEEPIVDDQLKSALEALAGPPMRDAQPAAQVGSPEESQGETAAPSRTEILPTGEGRSAARAADPLSADTRRGGDPVIGRLHRTLDLLEDRLRSRKNRPGAQDGGDALERSLLELSPVPMDADVEVPDPGESHSSLEIVRLNSEPGPTNGDARQSTVLLEAAAPPIDPLLDPASSRQTGQVGTSSWPEARSGPLTFEEVHEMSSGRLLHDRPRRAAPLPVDGEGTLDKVEVPRLLWNLHRGGFTGRLTITLGRADKQVWLENGEVCFARSNLEQDRLADALLGRGLLTRTQYDTARRMAAKEPRRAGQVLVEAGFLKPDELPRVLREHLRRIIDSTFPWNEGTWSLAVGERCEEAVKLEHPLAALIFDGVRHRLERTQLWALLGGPRQYPCLSEPARQRYDDVAKSLGMSVSEASWLPRLEGRRSLEELAASPGTDELELLAVIYGLHVLELLQIQGEARAAPAVATDPADVDRPRVQERLRLARDADYFELLGLSRDATAADVRRAHADLAKTFADNALEAKTRETMAVQLQEIRAALSEARNVLADDALRNAYLAHLEEP